MRTKPTPRSVPRRNDKIQWREFGSDAILLDPVTGAYTQINDTGVLIWKHVDGRRTIEEIVEEVSACFDDAEADVAEDVARFIEELIDKQVLSIGHASPF